MKGDIGMANYEKQVEQEAAYPIPISLYNCYRTVRQEKRGIAIYILLIAFLLLTAIVGVNTSNVESRKYVKPLLMFTALVALLPIVYLCGVAVWWIYKRTPFGYRPVQQLTDSDQPDRLINSGNYKDSSTSINTVSD